MGKVYKKVELDLGEVEVTYAMIDTDGTTLEQGMDVFYNGKYAFCVVGLHPDRLSEDDLEYLNDRLYDFKFK
jgi:hypothetical protein